MMGVGVAGLGQIFDAIKKGFEAAEVAVRDVRSVVESLNGARSVVVIVANNTSKDFQLVRTHHNHGGFTTTAPGIVKSKDSGVFGSQSSAGSIATGTEGSVTYQIEGLEATLKWDNPFAGSNSADAVFAGLETNAYRVVVQAGAGNHKAQIQFDLFEIETNGFNVIGAILDKWAENRWGAGLLGYPTTDETITPDGVGRYNHFQGGSIYWSPATGARITYGGIRDKWASTGWENGFLGYPTTDHTGPIKDGGYFQHFQGGSIYWSPATGACITYGGIRDKWASTGWENGFLGYPTTDHSAVAADGSCSQQFQGGTIYWTTKDGATVVRP